MPLCVWTSSSFFCQFHTDGEEAVTKPTPMYRPVTDNHHPDMFMFQRGTVGTTMQSCLPLSSSGQGVNAVTKNHMEIMFA